MISRALFILSACAFAASAHAGAVGPVRTPNSAWDVVYNATVGAAPGAVTKSGPTFTHPTSNSAKANFPGVNQSFPVAPTSRSYGSGSGGVSVIDTVAPVVGGMVIDVVATRVVPPSAWPYIAVAGAFAGGYMAGSAIKEYFDKNGVDFDPVTKEFSVFEGATTPTDERWVATNPAIPIAALGIKSAACIAAATYYNQKSMQSPLASTATTLSSTVSEVSGSSFKCVTSRRVTWNNGWLPSTVSEDVWFNNQPTGGSCVDKDGNLTPTVGGICNPGVKSPRPPVLIPPLLEKPPSNPPGLVDDVVGSGVPVPAGAPQLSGPSSKPGPSSNKSGPAGNVTTNTVNNYTYQGDTITITQTTTTTTTAPDGSTTTETKNSDEVDPGSLAPPRDPEMPELPTLYERKYPDGVSGVWNTRKAQLQTTPIFSFLSSLVPSTGDGGCPSWQLPVMYGIKNTSVVDISIPCWIWSAIRAIFIVTALVSCRRIIFGG